MLKLLAALTISAWYVQTAYSQTIDIPEMPNLKHEIGYVCLLDVQTDACAPPFAKYNAEGYRIPERLPAPNWGKTAGENRLPTQVEWLEMVSKMTGYDQYGFAVFGSRGDEIELRSKKRPTFSIWIPKAKVRAFQPTETLPVCELKGKNWWRELFQADLKSSANLNLEKEIPGDPFRGQTAIGVLEVKRNANSEICGTAGCRAAQVDVDASKFKVPPELQSRGPTTKLNLGFEHFLGRQTMASRGAKDLSPVDYLVVFDQKGDEYLLQTDIYNSPRIWIRIGSELKPGVRFLDLKAKESKTTLREKMGGAPNPRDEFLRFVSVSSEDSKWVDGQLWMKIKVYFQSPCDGPEAAALGTYWLKYSDRLGLCPKGC